MPQLQLSMEVFNLETSHFVQYKPDGGEFDPPILEMIEVKRDRIWFDKNLPLFQQFISDLEKFKSQCNTFNEIVSIPKTIKEKKRKLPDEFVISNYDDISKQDLFKNYMEI